MSDDAGCLSKVETLIWDSSSLQNPKLLGDTIYFERHFSGKTYRLRAKEISTSQVAVGICLLEDNPDILSVNSLQLLETLDKNLESDKTHSRISQPPEPYCIVIEIIISCQSNLSGSFDPAWTLLVEKAPEYETLITATVSELKQQLPLFVIPNFIEPYVPHADVSLDDYLDIDNDVYPLAALIARKAINPPIAIGIFGEWGVGKSFLLRKLEEQVSLLSASDPKANFFYSGKEIIQIRFNAWEYMRGNLWASLVLHIIESLGVDKLLPHLHETLKANIKEKNDLVTKLDAETEELRVKEAELNTAIRRHENVKLQDAFITALKENPQAHEEYTKIIEKAKAVIPSLQSSLEQPAEKQILEIASAIEDTKADLYRTRSTLRELMKAVVENPKDRFFVLVYLTFSLCIPLLAVFVAANINQILNIAIGGISIAVWAGYTWFIAGYLIPIIQQANTRLVAAESALRQLDLLERKYHTDELAKIEETKVQISEIQNKIAQLEQKALDIQSNITQLEVPRIQLTTFINERLKSDDYRQHLGLMALIRSDFQKLSNLIFPKSDNGQSGLSPENDLVLKRVILYIDDLDRCSADKVIEVLQAIHLLLAFPLFVVVVAIDIRWVLNALKSQYPTLMLEPDNTNSNHLEDVPYKDLTASPYDYLEKIFQIPFWLENLDAAQAKRMVHELTRPLVKYQKAVQAISVDVQQGSGSPASSAAEEPKESKKQNYIDMSDLSLTSPEVEFMELLAPIISGTPRDIERFVNLYYLLKVRQLRQDGRFMTDDVYSDHKKVLFLLTLFIGVPRLSEYLVRAIAQSRVKGKTFGQFLSELSKQEQASNCLPELNRLMELISTSQKLADWQSIDLVDLRDYCRIVWRYSFRLHDTLSGGVFETNEAKAELS